MSDADWATNIARDTGSGGNHFGEEQSTYIATELGSTRGWMPLLGAFWPSAFATATMTWMLRASSAGWLACPLDGEGVPRLPPSNRTTLARWNIALLFGPVITYAKSKAGALFSAR